METIENLNVKSKLNKESCADVQKENTLTEVRLNSTPIEEVANQNVIRTEEIVINETTKGDAAVDNVATSKCESANSTKNLLENPNPITDKELTEPSLNSSDICRVDDDLPNKEVIIPECQSSEVPKECCEIQKNVKLETEPVDDAVTSHLPGFSKNLSGTNDATEDVLALKRRRLSGAARKRLRRLLAKGIPYDSAVEAAISQVDERSQSISAASANNKGKNASSKNAPKRKVEESAESSLRIGVTLHDYPKQLISKTNLGILKNAIMNAVEEIPDNGPQVRFQSCSFRPGWLMLDCADEITSTWLKELLKDLQPWNGAQLKAVLGKDLPRPHISTVFIPNDVSNTKLPADKVLTRLKKMNHGLQTEEWTVINCQQEQSGDTWTFSIDETSFRALRGMDHKPYYGFTQVHFKPLNNTSKEGVFPSNKKKRTTQFLNETPSQKSGYLTASKTAKPHKKYRKLDESTKGKPVKQRRPENRNRPPPSNRRRTSPPRRREANMFSRPENSPRSTGYFGQRQATISYGYNFNPRILGDHSRQN